MQRLTLAAAILFAGVVFALGIDWGLPTPSADTFLFGDRQPWTGAQIQQLIGHRAMQPAADVDRDPLVAGDQPVLLNATDRDRAAIVLRYRLYSAQPDEMITFMSLARMRPRQLELDPRLYQYGGLWVYGVGAVLGAAKSLGFVQLQSDLAFYLDRPAEFGRFYVVARVYAAAWGIAAVPVVWSLTRRMTRSTAPAAIAAFAFPLLPVVVNMAHEAKPHLPAAAIMLMACLAAVRFTESGRRRWWIITAILCGGAVSMILSAWPVVLVVPAMLLARNVAWSQRAIIAIASAVIAADVYLLTNPYVLRHAMTWNQPDNPLRSNLENSRAMYRAQLSWEGTNDAARLLGYAATPLVAVVGVLAVLPLAVLREKAGERVLPADTPTSANPPLSAGAPSVRLILLAPTVVILIQFTLLAEGKPGEYARFALFPAVVLLMFAVTGLWRIGRGGALAWVAAALLTIRVGIGGASYVWHFINDASERPVRLIAAERLRTFSTAGAVTLAVRAEPAPYSVPPIDLWAWQLWLIPRGQTATADVAIEAVDFHPPRTSPGQIHWIRRRLLPTPISWAGKPFVVSINRPDATQPSRIE